MTDSSLSSGARIKMGVPSGEAQTDSILKNSPFTPITSVVAADCVARFLRASYWRGM